MIRARQFCRFNLSIFLLLLFGASCQSPDPLISSLQALDYEMMETPVADKIRSLVHDVSSNGQDDAEKWGKLAINLFLHGQKDLSIPCYQIANNLDPGEFRWPYFCAIAMSEKNDSAAIQWFKKAQQIKPQYAPMLIRYGDALVAANQLSPARKIYSDARAANGNLLHAQVGLGRIYLQLGHLDSARAVLETAVGETSHHREAYGLLADIRRRSGRPEAAATLLKKAQEFPEKTEIPDPVFSQIIDEGVSSFWNKLRGDILLDNRQFARAEQEFRAALTVTKDADTYNALGFALQQQGKFSEAAYHYQQAMNADSTYLQAKNNLSVVLFKSGQPDEAIAHARAVLRNDETNADAWLNLGTFLRETGRTAESIQAFRGGFAACSDDLRLAYQLAWLLATSPDPAHRDGNKAILMAGLICDKTKDKHPGALDALAAAYAENRQYDQAVKSAQKAILLAKNDGNRQLARAIQQRLGLYRARQPYREMAQK